MEILNQKLKPLNPLADKVPQITALAKQVGVESGVILGGGLLVAGLITFILFGSTIITLVLTVLYPAFKSIQALETESSSDDKEWLTYWIVFGLFSLIDDCCGCILSMIPYWYWIKLGFFVFLLAPQTRGAQTLYNLVVKPFLEKNRSKIEGLINDVKGGVSDIASEAKRTAVKEMQDPSNLMRAANLANQAQQQVEGFTKKDD